ncbi:MAG: hypothetical protein RBG1_1C00001G1645 [candidate division Zixibacteria bacterium RBG-1]|nr:MAG: hypothetical protein RBG1_1C00001G1645 [candidate division Zixibacteria bacterium RBG-1]OGC86607.1 MAG: hypothetical protein A2V73_07220 [candidate division Zixibacteria bacterium RBG_19FT_COMBO_42_43]
MERSLKTLKDNFLVWLVSWLGPALVWLLGKTLRISWRGLENLQEVRKSGQRVIYALWHGRLLILTFAHRWQKVHVLISQHRDGEFIARTVQKLGFVPIRGSTTRGGTQAIFQMVSKIQDGYDLAITTDGPKGPPHKVQSGAIYIAQRSGLPIMPISSSAQKAWRLKSWDSFLIPKPFSKTVIILGKPIYVKKESTDEELSGKIYELEKQLSELTTQADTFFHNRN